MSLDSVFSWISENIVHLLPLSPFRQFLDDFSNIPYLGYMNWLIPVKSILIVLTAWLSVVALFYLYSIVLRWVKVIGD